MSERGRTAFHGAVGCIALACPLLASLLAREIDRSPYSHHPAYLMLAPIVLVGVLAVALVVPIVLIARWRASGWWRAGAVVIAVMLLVVELYWTFFFVVVTP